MTDKARPDPPAQAPRHSLRDRLQYDWADYAILRRHWHNFHQIAPGVYRSNQPNHDRFARYRAMGIRTVLNLRGTADAPHYRFEKASCAALGLTLVTTRLHARAAASRRELLDLIGIFDNIEKPFLMHCKSGADRAGLAAALYLMTQEGADLATARRQLSLRFLHIRRSETGILDHMFDVFERRQQLGAIGIRDWIATEYDAAALTASFAASRRRGAGR